MALTQPLRDEHAELAPHIDALRTAADAVGNVQPADLMVLVNDSYEFLAHHLIPHAAAEEETLYATIMAMSDLRHDAQHSVSEHKELSELFVELTDMDMASSGWLNKFNKLAEEYTHHIDEEEEEKFPKAKSEMDPSKAIELREEFNARKPEEEARAEAGTDEEEIRKELAEGE